jgi:hypothetical protein
MTAQVLVLLVMGLLIGGMSSARGDGQKTSFRVMVTPDDFQLSHSSQEALEVKIVGEEGFRGPVTVHVADLPNGMTAEVEPASVTLDRNGMGVTRVLLRAPEVAPPGQYLFHVVVEGGGQEERYPVKIELVHGCW